MQDLVLLDDNLVNRNCVPPRYKLHPLPIAGIDCECGGVHPLTLRETRELFDLFLNTGGTRRPVRAIGLQKSVPAVAAWGRCACPYWPFQRSAQRSIDNERKQSTFNTVYLTV